jgi:hypothetical protein
LIKAILLISVVLFFSYIYNSYRSSRLRILQKIGYTTDIKTYITELLNSNIDHTFLIIRVEGTDQFTQISGSKTSAMLDFPQVTKEQKNLKSKIIQISEELNLNLVINYGTDGSEFLDFNLEGAPSHISEIVTNVLSQLYNINKRTRLIFETYGY